MSPDFVLVARTADGRRGARCASGSSTAPREALSVVFVADRRRSRRRLGLGRPADPGPRREPALGGGHRRRGARPSRLGPRRHVRKMSDFNLTVAPVLDPEHGSILGVITVDDVLELLLPSGLRRDFGVTAAEE